MSNAPAGIYDDPREPGRQRYWDGSRWGEQLLPPGGNISPNRGPDTSVNMDTHASGGTALTAAQSHGSLGGDSLVAVESYSSWASGRARALAQLAALLLVWAASAAAFSAACTVGVVDSAEFGRYLDVRCDALANAADLPKAGVAALASASLLVVSTVASASRVLSRPSRIAMSRTHLEFVGARPISSASTFVLTLLGKRRLRLEIPGSAEFYFDNGRIGLRSLEAKGARSGRAKRSAREIEIPLRGNESSWDVSSDDGPGSYVSSAALVERLNKRLSDYGRLGESG
jgi:hypothetical protein